MTLTYILTACVLFVGLTIMLVDAAYKLRGSEHLLVSVVLIATSILYVVFDCVCVFEFSCEPADYDQALFTVANALFYLAYASLPFVWCLFTLHFLRGGKDPDARHWAIIAAPWGFNMLLVILTVAGLGTVWQIGDVDHRYARGPLFSVFSNLNFVYYFLPLLVIIVSFILHRRIGRDRATTITTIGFSLIPALGVAIYTLFIPVEAIYPFQPCCIFIGVMFAYILIISEVHHRATQERALLIEEAEAAAKIAELQESMTSLLANMPAMTFSKDAETGRYLACNQRFAEYAKKGSPHEVIGLTDYEIFDPLTARHFKEDDAIALAMDEPYTFFEDVHDASGEPRQFQTTKLKYRDTKGRLCTLGMGVDVSEMAKMRQETMEAKANYERARSASMTYSHIARALSADYRRLYYVDVQNDHYVGYNCDATREELEVETEGDDFFNEVVSEALEAVYAPDREAFAEVFTKDVVVGEVAELGAFSHTYRTLVDGVPAYMNMKATPLENDRRHIIIGVNNVDAQMRHKEEAKRMKEERITYRRFAALAGNYICIYNVDPTTGDFTEYAAKEGYEELGFEREGTDFFEKIRAGAPQSVYAEDVLRFLAMFTRDNVMHDIEQNGVFSISYRVKGADAPIYVNLRAALVEEDETDRLIVGVSNIDAYVRRELAYNRNLAKARTQASVDALTGVKNKHAYDELAAALDAKIEKGSDPAFAILVFDVNDLKRVNDEQGHQAGDTYIRSACATICSIFKHSPVFRVGGDEFCVIAKGHDFEHADELMAELDAHNEEAAGEGAAPDSVVIACGLARYEGDRSVADVFERADAAMYARKRRLKDSDDTRGESSQDSSDSPAADEK